jgi:methylated-DNA-[protein]-cysteine S-methyltransferase
VKNHQENTTVLHIETWENRPISSPVGDLWLEVLGGRVVALSWQELPGVKNREDRQVLEQARKWLQDYFLVTGKPPLPPPFSLKPSGTPFQQAVWQQLMQIPVGTTVTYGAVAKALHTAPRAVGQAVGANPIPIIIPCHRVMAQNGWGGYSGFGGIETKKILLALEA